MLLIAYMETRGVGNQIIATIHESIKRQITKLSDKPFNGNTIQMVERDFFNTIGESGTAGLTELLVCNAQYEKTLNEDGTKYYQKFISTGKYLTFLGEISVKRGIYQSNKQDSICPLEREIKFINNYVSFAAAEYICYSMASMTLSEFTEHCRKWMLMKPCDATVRKVMSYVGNFLENNDYLGAIRGEESTSKDEVTLAISLDATSVLIKKKGWHHATAATLSTYDIDGNRLKTTYLGRMPETGKRKIKVLLEQEVAKRTAEQKYSNIVCVADGAREFWKYFRKKYPKAIHVIDFYHVCEHLSKLSEILFQKNSEAKTWFEKYRTILKEDPNGASKVIRAARYRRMLCKKSRAKYDAKTEIKFLQRNRRRMNYYNLRQNNLPIGSGVVEAACKNLIGARMKKSGMHWTMDGGQTVLTLRSLILSNRWDKFWKFFIRQHFPMDQC